eukprot:UN21971
MICSFEPKPSGQTTIIFNTQSKRYEFEILCESVYLDTHVSIEVQLEEVESR